MPPVLSSLTSRQAMDHHEPSRRTTAFTCRAGCKERDVAKNRNAGPVKCNEERSIRSAPLQWLHAHAFAGGGALRIEHCFGLTRGRHRLWAFNAATVSHYHFVVPRRKLFSLPRAFSLALPALRICRD